MDRDVLEKIFSGVEQLAMISFVCFVICVITVPLAIWKIIDLLW